MNAKFLGYMVGGVIDDFSQPESAWQLVVLAFCLALAWVLSKLLIRVLSGRQHERSLAGRYAASSLRKSAFPLFGWLLLLGARWAVADLMPTNVLRLALVPLFGLGALYVTFFMARRVLGVSGKAIGVIKLIERVLVALVWIGMLFYVLGVGDSVLSWLDSIIVFVINGKSKISLLTVFVGCAWALLSLVIALLLSSMVSDRIERAQDLDVNLKEVLSRLVRILLIAAAVLVSLSLLGIDLTALSVFGGALGVALGFGLQKIASNYVSGFIILLDHSLRLGDLVVVEKYAGVVTQIRTRYTVLRAADDSEVLVPNELMIASVVQNHSYSEKLLRLFVQVSASYQSEPEFVLKVIAQAVQGIPRILKTPAPTAFLVNFGESGALYELGFWVADPERGRLNVQSDVNLAIWRAFAEHGIEIPYPRRMLRMLNDEKNAGI
ncbi:MAG: mechanosensitive ion channel [Ottowia sp.]|nr:mechanosensitive ion channel [Ottowia sp.]